MGVVCGWGIEGVPVWVSLELLLVLVPAVHAVWVCVCVCGWVDVHACAWVCVCVCVPK